MRKTRKLLCILLAVLVVITSLPVDTYAATDNTPDTSWYDAGSTSFHISTADALMGFAQLVNGGNDFTGKTVYLDNDIVLNDNAADYKSWGTSAPTFSWTAIGTSDHPFAGTFDGGNHTVAGIYIHMDTTKDDWTNRYQGFFGYSTGTVKNIGVINSYIAAGVYVGGIVGYAKSGTVSNCYNTGIVQGYSNVGGITGTVGSLTLQYCYNKGDISGDSDMGGIVGSCNNSISLNYCYNTGNVTASSVSSGIVGLARNATINCCYNTGDIKANQYCGGIIGYDNSASTVSNCYSIGNILCSDMQGGIDGYGASVTYSNCYFTGSERAANLSDTVDGIKSFNPIYSKTTLAYGEQVDSTGVNGVAQLKPYFGNDFNVSLVLAPYLGGRIAIIGQSAKAVGVDRDPGSSYDYVGVKTITVTQNALITSGYTGTASDTTRTISVDNRSILFYTTKATDNSLAITCNGFVYDGTTTPSPQVTENKFGAEVKFEYTDENNLTWNVWDVKKPGTYTVKGYIPETLNYNRAESTVTFTIDKMDSIPITFPDNASEIKAGQTLGDSVLSGGSTQYGTFAWKYPSTVVNISDSNVTQYEVVFTPNAQTSKYYKRATPSTGTLSVAVKKRTPTFSISCEDVEQGVNLSPQVKTNSSGGTVIYEYKQFDANDSTYTQDKPTIPGTYLVRGTVAETDEYLSATATCYAYVSGLRSTLKIACPDIMYGETIQPSVLENTNGGEVQYVYFKTDGPVENPEGHYPSEDNYLNSAPTEAGYYGVMALIEPHDLMGYAEDTVFFQIKKIDVNNLTCQVDTMPLTYSGDAQMPQITLKNGDAVLNIGTDYTVSYSKNVNAGTAIVTISGSGTNYTGTIQKTFAIAGKSIAGFTANLSASVYTYTGAPVIPVLTVTDGTRVLKNGTDYTVSCINNVNIGTATVTITGIGNNYIGTIQKTFTITEKNVADLAVNLSAYSYIYTGKEKKPTVTVMDGSKVLKKGTDYTVTYSGNKNPGTASVTVTGKGIYTGSVTKTFAIQPIAVTMQAVATNKAATVSWSKSGGSTGYAIYMSTKKKGTYTQVKTVKSTTKSYKQKGLKKGKTYYFKVRAYKDTKQGRVYGNYSTIESVKVK